MFLKKVYTCLRNLCMNSVSGRKHKWVSRDIQVFILQINEELSWSKQAMSIFVHYTDGAYVMVAIVTVVD